MYLCDIHSHSKLSPDCFSPLRDMARSAIAAGLREFCVTDHCDMLDLDGKPWGAFDWPAAKAQYRAVSAELGALSPCGWGLSWAPPPMTPPPPGEF